MGFTCGFDTPPTAAAAVVGYVDVPVTAAILAVAPAHDIAAFTAILAIDAIAFVPASTVTQHDLWGHFQPKLDTMDIQIYNALCKKRVLQKDSPQARILAQHYGRGIYFLCLIIVVDHPVNSTRLAMII